MFSIEETVVQAETKKIQPSTRKLIDKKSTFNPKKNTNYENKEKNNCYVLFAKDGDTFDGMLNGEKVTFRLAGVDSPEKDEPLHKEAGNFLNSLIKKKVVYLEFLGKDPYGRTIVEVFLDKEKNQHVNKMMLNEGFATSERYKNNENEYTHSTVEYISNELSELKGKMKI